MATKDSTGTFVAGFVIGGVIGTAIAQIFAPQHGQATHRVYRTPWRELNTRTTPQTARGGSLDASLPAKRSQ